MERFVCDGSFDKDFQEYTDGILKKDGISSQSAQREIMYMADAGNIVCAKLYGDMIYYKKTLCKDPYRQAFLMYLQAAGITSDQEGKWQCSGKAYPLAFWNIGLYLVNYKRESLLKNSETISMIENMTIAKRLLLACRLSVDCISYIKVPGAINLLGRILQEVSGDEALFQTISAAIFEIIQDLEYPVLSLDLNKRSQNEIAGLAQECFRTAAREGYVYAANNLAAKEADVIVETFKETEDAASISDALETYIRYLKYSADRYEPYAANRLGLFYATGEIKGAKGTVEFREYIDFTLAKTYFHKAIVYPDVNSAWAFYNLIKYFRRNYMTDLDLMNEHMDYIKELNPKVYDLAMEL